MLTLPSSVRVYLAAQPVDLRRGHDGLVALVRSTWRLNPFDGHLFVFLGRRLDRVKILVWDRNGFVLYYKRLSQGRFRMPSIPAGATRVEMDATMLAMLLDGIDVRQVRRPVVWSPPAVGASAPPA
jgi:transposase